MKKITYKKLKAGDVFSIPLCKGKYGIGVVVIAQAEMYICVHKEIFSQEEVTSEIETYNLTPFLIARTSDELFYHGDWKVVGRDDRKISYPMPCYVVNGPDGMVVKKFDGEYVRQADEDDLGFFGRKFSVSNVTFVEALQVAHGLDLGDPSYDYNKIYYSRAMEREC